MTYDCMLYMKNNGEKANSIKKKTFPVRNYNVMVMSEIVSM